MGKKRVVRGMKTKARKLSNNATHRRAEQLLDSILQAPDWTDAYNRVIATRLSLVQADARIGNILGWHRITEANVGSFLGPNPTHGTSTGPSTPIFTSSRGFLLFQAEAVMAADEETLVQAMREAVEAGITSGAIPATVVAAVDTMIEDR